MNRTDRRTALQLALGAALAPIIATRQASASTPDRLIAPPTTAMRYARSVTREIPGGEHFTVSRNFTVTFRQFAGGFMLHGQQERVEVDAPSRLEPFAQLERERDESGLFPLALDPFGQIMSTETGPLAGEDVRKAIEEALATLASQGIGSDERERLSRFISAFQLAGQRVTAHLPADLFAPTGTPRREEQRIALPGGGEGVVETRFDGERDVETGLMRAAARDVITLVADSSRRTREEWSLAAM